MYLYGTNIINDIKVIGKIEKCNELKQNKELSFIIAIGNNNTRKKISNEYDLEYYTAIHPTAVIGIDVYIEKGTTVMANAVINSGAKIGKHCIINTGAIIEHDNILQNFIHISPNVTLCGTVTIGEKTHIGAGTVVKNNIEICNSCVIGAGAVVVKDIKQVGTYIGIPAKRMEQ